MRSLCSRCMQTLLILTVALLDCYSKLYCLLSTYCKAQQPACL